MADVVRRVAVAVVLLASLVAMGVHYGAVGIAHDQTMSSQAALADYDAAIGESVYFWGRVVRQAEGATVVDAGAETVTVATRIDAPPGAVVQVAGEVRPDRRIDPERVVVSRGSRGYLYAVSLLGVAVAAGAFLRSWRFDADRLAFVARGDGDA